MADFYQAMNFGDVASQAFTRTATVLSAMIQQKRKNVLQDMMLPLELKKAQTELANMEIDGKYKSALADKYLTEAKQIGEAADGAGSDYNPFGSVWNSGGPSSVGGVKLTSYTPGQGDPKMEGGVLAADGKPAYTMEQFHAGKAPYVAVAMDPQSPWRGKYLRSKKFPNTLFKVTDTGGAFKGKGLARMDIAFSDPLKAKSFEVDFADFTIDDSVKDDEFISIPK